MRRAVHIVGLVVATSLACGGGMTAAEIDAADLCASSKRIDVIEGLPELARDLPEPKLSVHLVLDGQDWVLDGTPVARNSDQLRQLLDEKVATAKDLAAKVGGGDFAFRGEILLSAAASVPGPEIVDLVQLVHESGFTTVSFVVVTGPRDLPPLVDPAYGAELEQRVEGLPSDQRAVTLATEISELLRACPPGAQAFQAVAAASAEMKCMMLEEGLKQALPMCPLTDGGRVLTAFQVMTRGRPVQPGIVQVTLDPAGKPHALEDRSWGEQVAALADAAREPLWLVRVTTE